MQMWIRSQQWRNCDGQLFLDSFGTRQSRVLMGLELVSTSDAIWGDNGTYAAATLCAGHH